MYVCAPKNRPVGAGARLVRIWRGRTYEATVRDDGRFEWGGRIFSSITALARAITGMHINGKVFFGLTK